MVSYWVAAHITGLFIIHNESNNILYQGSRGAGFSISRGVTTTVEFSEDKNNHFFFNDKETSSEQAKVSNRVLSLILEKVSRKFSSKNDAFVIKHDFEIPVGAGFGASAAGALSLAFALNDLLDLNLSQKELYSVAHSAEVLEGGGLGDVIGLYQGGWEYRTKPGSPFIGQTESMIEDRHYNIATIVFGEMPTNSIIKNQTWKQRINAVGTKYFNKFLEEPTITNFVYQAQQFSIETELITPEIRAFYDRFKGGSFLFSQIMLGNSIFLLYNKKSELSDIDVPFNEERICKKTLVKR